MKPICLCVFSDGQLFERIIFANGKVQSTLNLNNFDGSCGNKSFFTDEIPTKDYNDCGNIAQTTIPINLAIDGYALSVFVDLFESSRCYRHCVISNLKKLGHSLKVLSNSENSCISFGISLVQPTKHIIDFEWNTRMERLVIERRELDHTMSWLSTLGGAFSALGDEFEHWAVMAGKVSLHQLWIGIRLGDPLTVCRCRLYFALSLMQIGQLKQSRRIIEEQYRIAKNALDIDPRLVKMCLGVWAKLKYCHHMKCLKKKSKS